MPWRRSSCAIRPWPRWTPDGSKALFTQLLREQPLLNNIILRSAGWACSWRRPSTAPVRQPARPACSFRCSASGRPAVSQLEVGSVHRPADGAGGVSGAGRRFADGGCPRHQPQPAAARAAVCERLPAERIDRHAGRSERTRDGAEPGEREVHRRGVRSAARAEGCAAHPSAAGSRRGRAVSRQRRHRTRPLAAERGRSAQRGVRARRARSIAGTS